jgi:hypothetical protein
MNLQDRLANCERQLASKADALAILQRARKSQEEHLIRQVGVIEELETELRLAVSERSGFSTKSPNTSSTEFIDDTRVRRRRTREDIFHQFALRGGQTTVYDNRTPGRRRAAKVA